MKSASPIALAALVALTACGGGIDPVENPNQFVYRMDDGVIRGSYNPAGFSAKQVKFFAKQYCSQTRLGSYSESAAAENGLIGFQASCSGGLPYGGHAVVARQADGSVLVEATLSKDGNIFFDQKTF